MSEFDIARARAETRGCARVAHLNNAGSSLTPAPVADYLRTYLDEEEMLGGYEVAARRDGDLENFYTATARLLNASSDEIAFIENATRAWDMAFYAIPFEPGDRILTAMAEYSSNMIAYIQRAKATGVTIEIVPNDASGQLDVAALEAMIDDRVKLIAITHVPTGGGLVNPAEEIGRVARKHDILYLLDACQSVGQMPVDVEAIGCDMLSATGRKYLRGPRGTGFLYVRRNRIEMLEPPFLDLFSAELVATDRYVVRSDARKFENWERYFAGQAALGHAIDYALDWDIDAIWDRVKDLGEILRASLAALPGVEVTDEGEVRCGIVTFRKQDETATSIKARLAEHGINVSTSSASGTLPSFQARGIDEVVRASVHYYNTEDEIAALVEVLR